MYKVIDNEDTLEILLYSLIEGGTTAGNVLKQLKDAGDKKIVLRINSDGGEAFDAIALYNYLKPLKPEVIIDGICASAASIVAMAGSPIKMHASSMMMIHNPRMLTFGDSEDHKDTAAILEQLGGQVAGIYAARTGKSEAEILNIMGQELWITADIALREGFIDEVIPLEPASLPEPEAAPIEVVDRYEEGVRAERARLRALDELALPGREVILNEAKYITCQTAQDIALELLRLERPVMAREAAVDGISSLSVGAQQVAAFNDMKMDAILGRIRGGKK